MLRRFEIYSFDPAASPSAVAALRTGLRDCAAHIPEVRHSAVGDDRGNSPLHLAWEHAYRSPADYRRYMVHPFHASVLDRYLLADSPERVTTDNGVGIGLLGYACAEPRWFSASGLRRLVVLDLGAATPDQVADVEAVIASAGLATSVLAPNTLGSAWFDGETPVGPASRWTHLWEQAFADEGALQAYLDGPSPAAACERAEWRTTPGVTASVTVWYRIEPGYGYHDGP